MKRWSLILLLCCNGLGWAQQTGTNLSEEEYADTVYGMLGTHVSTGYLMNKVFMDTSISLMYHAHLTDEYHSNADLMHNLLYELWRAALDTSSIPDRMELYNSVSQYIGEHDFDDDMLIYPVGITDYMATWLDEQYGTANGLLTKNGASWVDTDPNDNSAYHTFRTHMVGPLFDMISDVDMALVFRSEDFRSNHKSQNDVVKIQIYHNGTWFPVNWDVPFLYDPAPTEYQYFRFQITYSDGDVIENDAKIYTPELYDSTGALPKGDFDFPECSAEWIFEDFMGNQIKACLIPGCSRPNATRPEKPFILPTGYRPPIFSQSFKKTWKLYGVGHRGLLQRIHENDYDIILVKFNLSAKPYTHGIEASTNLFKQMIKHINLLKGGSYHENVIMSTSMSCDITSLALLEMEKEYQEDQTGLLPYHHCREYIAYDGNYYGANIPLAYQYQIYSGFRYPVYSNLAQILPGPNWIYYAYQGIKTFFTSFLYATMEQRAVKDLLIYHAEASENNMFPSLSYSADVTPAMHSNRLTYYSRLNAADNGNHFYPFPRDTRNVAVSLAKIREQNPYLADGGIDDNFKFNGEYWRYQDLGVYKSWLRTGTYSTTPIDFFRRRKTGNVPYVPGLLNTVEHTIKVSEMMHVDQASGSPIVGLGNIISVTDWTYFSIANIFNGKNMFSHKSALTALCINPNLWPADHTWTLDLQVLDLMFTSKNQLGILQLSNYFGYPNLGRPNDHFEITPFEAININDRIDPHIVLKNSLQSDVDEINNFILNETEAWWLGMQNQALGSQAKLEDRYKARREAKYLIIMGNEVTPSTDPGPFVVQSNADCIFMAGEGIDLYANVTIEPGANAYLYISKNLCGTWGRMAEEGGDTPNPSEDAAEFTAAETYFGSTEIRIYPNPNQGTFTIASMQNIPIQSFEVYDFSGKLVLERSNLNVARYTTDQVLDQGSYVIVLHQGKEVRREKIVVL